VVVEFQKVLRSFSGVYQAPQPFDSFHSLMVFDPRNTVECLERSGEGSRTTSRKMLMFYVYILRTSSNTLYIGQTNNLEKRLKEHQGKSSKSAKYARYFDSMELVYSEEYLTRKEAMQREAELKKWPKIKKEVLVKGDIN